MQAPSWDLQLPPEGMRRAASVLHNTSVTLHRAGRTAAAAAGMEAAYLLSAAAMLQGVQPGGGAAAPPAAAAETVKRCLAVVQCSAGGGLDLGLAERCLTGCVGLLASAGVPVATTWPLVAQLVQVQARAWAGGQEPDGEALQGAANAWEEAVGEVLQLQLRALAQVAGTGEDARQRQWAMVSVEGPRSAFHCQE